MRLVVAGLRESVADLKVSSDVDSKPTLSTESAA